MSERLPQAGAKGLSQPLREHAALWILEAGLLAAILWFGAYLRLANNAFNPAWYSDEGTLLEIARNLGDGQVSYFGLSRSWLIVARLPLFPAVLGAVSGWWGPGIATLRTLTALLGLSSIGLLHLVVRRLAPANGRWLGLLAAALLAIYPQAIVHSRLGFSYNLLTPLVLLSFLGLGEFVFQGNLRWLLLAALAVGLGGISDLMIFSLALPVLLIASRRGWRPVALCLGCMTVPFGVYALGMLSAEPEAFLFDLRFTLGRLGEVPWIAQLSIMALNFAILLTRDPWLTPAIIGLFLLEPRRLRWLALLLFLVPLFMLGRTTGLASSLSFYYLTPLLPFVALGLAGLLYRGAPWVLENTHSAIQRLFTAWRWQPERPAGRWLQARTLALSSSLAVFLIVGGPLVLSAFLSFQDVSTGFQTAFDPVLVDGEDAEAVAAFVNDHAGPQELVIASPAVGWLVRSPVTDFQLALAYNGEATRHFPRDIPQARFEFSPQFSDAEFLIVDPIWRNWAAINIPGVAEWLERSAGWNLVYQAGQIDVYQNPGR